MHRVVRDAGGRDVERLLDPSTHVVFLTAVNDEARTEEHIIIKTP